MRLRLTALFAALLLTTNANAAPELNSNTPLATAGYFQLSWKARPNTNTAANTYILQQAENSHFRNAATLYNGPDQATVISGLPDRIYYYRVRLANDTHWSETVQVEVKHHSLARALSFFILGATMFLVTAGVLLKGARVRT